MWQKDYGSIKVHLELHSHVDFNISQLLCLDYVDNAISQRAHPKGTPLYLKLETGNFLIHEGSLDEWKQANVLMFVSFVPVRIKQIHLQSIRTVCGWPLWGLLTVAKQLDVSRMFGFFFFICLFVCLIS